jgi:tetratricopeptide (TPR) repeat protein
MVDHGQDAHAQASGDRRDAPAQRTSAWLPLLAVAAVSVAVYANTLANGLHVDDHYQIVTNPWVTSFRNLPAIFSSGVWDFDGRVSSYYRPMMYVLYSVVYAVAGTAPWAYHLLNVALHAGTAALAFLIAAAMLGARDARHPWWRSPALLTGLLFAVHPIHTEPVAWAAGVVDLSYGFFYLLALYLLIRGRDRLGYVVAALAAYAAALLSKEPAITLPAVALVYWAVKDGRQLGIRSLSRRLAPWVAVSLAYLALRSVVLGGVAPQTSPVGLSPWEYALTALALLGRFLRAQVFPTDLNFWHVFVPVKSAWSAGAALALLTVGAWAFLLAWAVRRRALVPAVGLTVAVLPLTPALLLGSLNQGLENAFAERYVYLPSFGVALLGGWAVAALEPRRAPLARALTAGLAALIVLGAAVTVQRNPVWKNSLSLWGDAAAKSPASGMANLNYGLALMGAGQTESGQRHVQRGVALAPELVDRKMRQAVSYAQAGRSTDAMLAFHNVLVMDPRSARAHYNLGVLHEERGETAKAVGEYLAAIALDPSASDAHNNLGILYFTGGYRDQAMEHLEEAVRLQPEDPAFRANLERARSR